MSVRPDDRQDIALQCGTCWNAFLWTADEQRAFASRGWFQQPRHCKPCRAFRRREREAERHAREAAR